MAEFKLSRLKYTWLGEWAAYGRYNPDDIVSYGGSSYVCLDTHVAANDFYSDLNFFNQDTPPLLVPKWELVAEGSSWQGAWAPSTYYRVGDFVSLGGTLYTCTAGHLSPAPTLLDPTGEQEFTLTGLNAQGNIVQIWSVRLSAQSWLADWSVSTYYKINDVVRYGGRVYRCVSAHSSAADLDEGLDANLADWITVSIADDWKGIWTVETKYKLNDLVKYGGNVYQCINPHVSQSTEVLGLDADINKWTLKYDGVQYRAVWATNTLVGETLVPNTYKLNDVVKFGSYLYKCILFHTASATFESSYWEIFCPGNQFDAVWQGAVTVGTTVITPPAVYQTGDIVRYGGTLYVALATSQNQNPSTATSAWAKLLDNSSVQGEWDQFHPYKPGDVVRRGGNLYGAILDNLNQDPDFINDGTTTNSVYWNLIITGSKWSGIWNLGRTYLVGETVVWVSSSYVCLDKHVADNTNRPDDDYYEDGSTMKGRYWLKVTSGNKINRLKKVGDLRTFGPTEDGSTVGYTTLEIGTEGYSAQTQSGLTEWRPMFSTPKVYYVALTGVDDPLAGTSPNSPWRTLRYALENITGYATVNVRTGVFEEVLPLRVPAYVAVQGDELRSTVIKPANNIIDQTYYDQITAASSYLGTIAEYVVQAVPIGADDPIEPQTILYGSVPQDISAPAATTDEALIITALTTQLVNRLENYATTSISGSNSLTTIANRLRAYTQMINNREFLKNEVTIYIENLFNDSTAPALPARWERDIERIIDGMTSDIGYVGNYNTIEAANFFINSFNYEFNKISNMFLLRDGTGLRNMTLAGLEGTLGPLNAYLTRRPTAGAYAS